MDELTIIDQVVSFAPAVGVLMWSTIVANRNNSRLIGLLIEIVRQCDCTKVQDAADIVRRVDDL